MVAKHSAELKKAYAIAAAGYNQFNFQNVDGKRADFFLQHLPLGGQILDFGAGNGRDSRYFASKGYKVTLLDQSPEMLNYARQNVPSASFIQADMLDVDLGQEQYDGIWANASLLHLTKSENRQVLKKLYDALKFSGVLYVKVIEGKGEKFQLGTKYAGEKSVKRFFSFFEESEIVELISSSGLKVLQHETYSSSSSQRSWVAVFGQKQ